MDSLVLTASHQGMPKLSPDDAEDRYAVVTGGASGIGAEVSRRFIRAGIRVAILDSDQEAGQGLARDLLADWESLHGSAGQEVEHPLVRGAHFVHVDVADREAVSSAFGSLPSSLQLRYAVNAAGICGMPVRFLEDTVENFSRVMKVNLDGVWHCMKEQLLRMKVGGGGSIVNVASVSGLKGFRDYSAYSTSKHALIGLTRSVAIEEAADGVTVNAVCPGMTDTPMISRQSNVEIRRRVLEKMPIGRVIEPWEVADLIVYLCLWAAPALTGQAVVIDGGVTA